MNVDTLIAILLTFDKDQPVVFEAYDSGRTYYTDVTEVKEDWEIIVAEIKSRIVSPVVLR